MGGKELFVVQMTKALVCWPAVALIVFFIVYRKPQVVFTFIDAIADRVKKIDISRGRVQIETVPRGRGFVQEIPYSKSGKEGDDA